jgi:hypothetical protein
VNLRFTALLHHVSLELLYNLKGELYRGKNMETD